MSEQEQEQQPAELKEETQEVQKQEQEKQPEQTEQEQQKEQEPEKQGEEPVQEQPKEPEQEKKEEGTEQKQEEQPPTEEAQQQDQGQGEQEKPVEEQPKQEETVQEEPQKQEEPKKQEQPKQQEEQEEQKPPEENAEDLVPKMPDDFFYEEEHYETTIEQGPIPTNVIQFYQIFGFDSNKKFNVSLLDSDTIIYSSGITYHVFNMKTKEDQVFFSKDGGGIGSISVHPSKKFFAVGEKGKFPNVYIYEYPSYKLYRILRKGTEQSFTTINFSTSGNQCVTVGYRTDFTITIWDWKQEQIMLKGKAFQIEILRVQFSEYSDAILGSSGIAHMKFWKVAETFTGLKLKGQIAKFGKEELSDVVAFYIFQDGKFITGTQYGKLFLWEGNLIKCILMRKIGKEDQEEENCHKQNINVCFRIEGDIITAGDDGFIKFWNADAIDKSEPDDDGLFEIEESSKIYLEYEEGVPANIISIVVHENFWLVSDQRGKLYKLQISENKIDCKIEEIMNTNAGPILDMAVSPLNNSAVTIGEDGAVRLWDYVNNDEFYSKSFKGQGTTVCWVPYTKRNLARIVIAGFSNGIVRWLLLEQGQIRLLKAIKIHKSGITHIKCTPDGSVVACASKDGDIFFLSHHHLDVQKLNPFCLYETGLEINDMCWDREGTKILLACNDGKLYESQVPKEHECHLDESYLREFNYRSVPIKMMEFQKPKTEEMDLKFLLQRNKNEDKQEEIEWDPEPLHNCCYYDEACTKALVSSEKNYAGYWYVMDFNSDRPTVAIPAPKIQTTYMGFDLIDTNILLVGFENGQYQLRTRNTIETNYLQVLAHDQTIGAVRKCCISYDRDCLVSASEDGTMMTYKLDFSGFKNAARGEISTQPVYPENLVNGLTETTFSEEIHVSEKNEEDILDDSIYSVQQQKLFAHEDYRKSEAEKKKRKVLGYVKELQENFEKFQKENEDMDEFARCTEEEMTIDNEFVEMVQDRIKTDIEETKKELRYDEMRNKIRTEKLQNYVQKELLVDTYGVRAIRNPKKIVQTLKVKDLSDYLRMELEKIFHAINEERANRAAQESEQGPTINVEGNATSNIKDTVKNNFDKSQKQKEEDIKKDAVSPEIKGAKADRMNYKLEEARIRQKMDELEKTKPRQDLFEPDHLRDIQEAEEKLGDYKLKSSTDYVVPDHQRMGVSKKRKHMFLLEEFIHQTKMGFNKEIENLKQRKTDIIVKVKIYNDRIQEINKELGITEELFTPKVDDASENPEHFYQISDNQIDEFARQERLKKKRGDDIEEKKVVDKEKEKEDKKKKAELSLNMGMKKRKPMKTQHSDLEEEMKKMNEMILIAEKQRMQQEVNEEIELFDKTILKCQNEKHMLERDLTIAQMKLVTSFQEYLVLIDMEEQDNKLCNDVLSCKKDKADLEEQSNNIVKDLTNLAARDQENEKQLAEQMKLFKENVYTDDDNKREKIHQYYLRKHKKYKAKQMKIKNQEEEDGDLDEEDMDSDEDDDDDLFDEDDDEKPDISPVENDPKTRDIIEKICELEDLQETNRKEKMDLERQKVQITNKIQNILKELQKAEKELKAYQLKKLQKVNQLDVSYCLRLDQIQNLETKGEEKKLPDNLNTSILFTQPSLIRLTKRIKELIQEQDKIDKNRSFLDKKKKKLEKMNKKKLNTIAELNNKYAEKHMLKFGDIIDLKILDALEPTKQVLDMREKFKQEEREAIIRVEKAKQSLLLKKKQLLKAKNHNTQIITQITQLGKEQMKLNQKLDSTNKQLFKEENEEKKNKNDLERERQNLRDLVKFLSKEIEDLKTEIGLFKRKGGHIYTMVTSNKKTFN